MRLADAILRAAASARGQALDAQVAAFEKDMFVRAAKTQQQTVDMMTAMFFTDGAPRASIERYVLGAMRSQLGHLLAVVVAPLVYLWFGMFKMIW